MQSRQPWPRKVAWIEVEGPNIRMIIDCLFKNGQMEACERSDIENRLLELDKCLEYNSKLTEEITLSQREIIEFLSIPM